MRRISYRRHGGPEVLELEEVPTPAPGPGELLVRNDAVGVTLPSVRTVWAGVRPTPLGGEVAGTVVALGESVVGFDVGDRVTGLCFAHAYAEFAVVNEAMASRVPEHADAVTAVALVRSGLVARGAHEAGRPRPGESVLITGAASATGVLAVQLAVAGGASRVVAAVSDLAKADALVSLGADEVVCYDDGSWRAPVDVVLDGVGGAVLDQAVRALAPGGRLVVFSSGGGSLEAHRLLERQASAIGFQLAAVARGRPATYARWRDELWRNHEEGALRTLVHAEIPLAEAWRAHEVIEARRNIGKVVLAVN